MSEHGRIRAAFTLLLTAAVLVCSGCYIRTRLPIKPYLTDRSTETDAVLMTDSWVCFLDEHAERYVTIMHVLGYDSVLPRYGKVEDEAHFVTLCDKALRDVLGEQYIDAGRFNIPETYWNSDENVWAYCGGKTYVAIRQGDGQVLACIDLRIHKNARAVPLTHFWEFKVDCDMLSLSRDDLMILSLSTYETENYRGPVADAEKAFEIAVDYASHFHYGPSSETIGEYTVYYSRVADAWVVHNRAYTLAIDPETGEYITDW